MLLTITIINFSFISSSCVTSNIILFLDLLLIHFFLYHSEGLIVLLETTKVRKLLVRLIKGLIHWDSLSNSSWPISWLLWSSLYAWLEFHLLWDYLLKSLFRLLVKSIDLWEILCNIPRWISSNDLKLNFPKRILTQSIILLSLFHKDLHVE